VSSVLCGRAVAVSGKGGAVLKACGVCGAGFLLTDKGSWAIVLASATESRVADKLTRVSEPAEVSEQVRLSAIKLEDTAISNSARLANLERRPLSQIFRRIT